MDSKRMYWLMLGLIGLSVIAIIACSYGADKLLQSKSKTLVALKLKSQVLTNEQTGLAKAKKDVQTYSGLEQIAKSIVPQDKDQAEAVREISKLAAASGIPQLSSVTFPISTLGGTTGTPSSSSSTSNLTQLTPVPGIPGVYNLQITIQQNSDKPVAYNKFITFLRKLEQNRRTAQVTSITLTPSTQDTSLVAFTLIVNEYIKP